MNGQKAKLIRKMANHLWNKKTGPDRQKWGITGKKNALGIIDVGMRTAYKRFYRHLKRSYIQGTFKISAENALQPKSN